MFVACTENANDFVAADSPWSESFEVTSTPELGTMPLLAMGFLALMGPCPSSLPEVVKAANRD
jgi:hypothetical protein